MSSTFEVVRRAFAVLLLSLVAALVALPALPAHAHGRGSDATNMRSRILEDPGIEGVTFQIHGGDELLEVVNDTDEEIVILGYEPEPRPYLRVGPDGVWENRNSEATYVNKDRLGQVSLPPNLRPDAEPDWVKVSDARSAAWHDHRIHYMSAGIPPAVTDPSEETVVIERWEVPFTFGGEQYSVFGDLTWIPGPPPWPWLLIGLVLALPALIGLRTEPETDPDAEDPDQPVRWPGLVKPAAAVLGVIVAVNLVNLADDLFAVPLPGSVRALAAGQTVLFLLIGAFGALRAWQAREGAFTALGVGSGAVLVGQGLLYWSVLSASQVASILPDLLARVIAGVSIAQALPIGIVAFVGTRRLLPPLPEDEEEATEPVGHSDVTA